MTNHSISTRSAFPETIERNLEQLRQNRYPGRGIILGVTPDERHMVQVYWIMGRSENSSNRVFIEEQSGFVRTEAFARAKLTDPSLIIYYPIKTYKNCHVVTNGDHTDTILDALASGKTFEYAMSRRRFEPDAPNYTPRIAGISDVDDRSYAYKLAIVKTLYNDSNYTLRHTYLYTTPLAGAGHCITTYSGDGNPVPAFEGEPLLVKIFDDLSEVASFYWELLNVDNRVSLLVKFINLSNGRHMLRIVNRHRS